MQPKRSSCKRGFTLVEVLIVVVILGVLAGIVIPVFAGASDDAERTTFVSNIRTFAAAAEFFRSRTGQYLEDSNSGTCPTGFEDYIQENRWENGTPLGGVWDAELNSFGITSAIGVHFNGQGATRNAAYMQEVDQLFDDGNLETGGFRQIAGDRYYYIISN